MQCWLHGSRHLEISASALRRYITNTKVKLVLVIAINATNFKDDDLIAVRLLIQSLAAGRVGSAGSAPTLCQGSLCLRQQTTGSTMCHTVAR